MARFRVFSVFSLIRARRAQVHSFMRMSWRCASLCHVKLTKCGMLTALCVLAMHSSCNASDPSQYSGCTSSYWHRHSQQAPAALASHTSLSAHTKLLHTVTYTISRACRQLQRTAASHSVAARHSRSVSSTRARTLARSSSVESALVLLCAASRDDVNIFRVKPKAVGESGAMTLLCGGRVKEPTPRTGSRR